MKDTSQQAFLMTEPMATRHRIIILETMKKYKRPMTSEVIATHCKLFYPQVWRRMSELVKSGKVVDSGRRERTSSGRLAVLWELSGQLKLF